MTLWDQLGGQTWGQRAGPRAAGTKPARRRHPARPRLKARGPRHADEGRRRG
jgi:hypothetical protein